MTVTGLVEYSQKVVNIDYTRTAKIYYVARGWRNGKYYFMRTAIENVDHVQQS